MACQVLLMVSATFPISGNKLQTTSGTTLKVSMKSMYCTLCSIFTLHATTKQWNHDSKRLVVHLPPASGSWTYSPIPWQHLQVHAMYSQPLHSIFCFATFLAHQKLVAVTHGMNLLGVCVYSLSPSVLLLHITSPSAEPRNIHCKQKIWKNCKGDLF